MRLAYHGFAGSMALLLALFQLGMEALPMLLALLSIGLRLPELDHHHLHLGLEGYGPIVSSASTRMGTLQLVVGTAVIAIKGLCVDSTGLPLVTGIAGSAFMAWGLVRGTLWKARRRSYRRQRREGCSYKCVFLKLIVRPFIASCHGSITYRETYA